MSRRSPSRFQLFVAALLLLQSAFPILPTSAVPTAHAQETNPVSVEPIGVDTAMPPVFQPEQALPPEAAIPNAESRLPQGRYTLRLAADGSATRFAGSADGINRLS